jgi:hypothetical protein
MFTQKGAEEALQAMAPASLKQDASSRQEDSADEFMQRVIGWQDDEAQQPK